MNAVSKGLVRKRRRLAIFQLERYIRSIDSFFRHREHARNDVSSSDSIRHRYQCLRVKTRAATKLCQRNLGDLRSLSCPAPSIESSQPICKSNYPVIFLRDRRAKNFLFVSHMSHFPHARSEVNAKGRRLSRFSPPSLPCLRVNQTYLRFNFKRVN